MAGKEQPIRQTKWQARMETGKRGLAAWLQKQSEKLSISSKKILLVTFIILFGSLMLWQVFRGIGSTRLPPIGMIAKPITPSPLQKMEMDSTRTDRRKTDKKSDNH